MIVGTLYPAQIVGNPVPSSDYRKPCNKLRLLETLKLIVVNSVTT